MVQIRLLLWSIFLIYKVSCDCGLLNVDGIGFKITRDNDNDSKFGEFPWTVGVLKTVESEQGPFKVYQCDGSLIHPSVVLTLADCISGKKESTLKVRAGEWDTVSTDEIFPHQDRQVSKYIIHEQYDKDTMSNDVALLILAEPFEITDNVNTICLPVQNANFDLTRCAASGWGKLLTTDVKFPTIMRRVELSVLPRDKCETERKADVELNDSFICVESGKINCKAFGGSPLVCPIQNSNSVYYQVGMISHGTLCGDATPGVHVNVPLYRDWIEEKLQFNNISVVQAIK